MPYLYAFGQFHRGTVLFVAGLMLIVDVIALCFELSNNDTSDQSKKSAIIVQFLFPPLFCLLWCFLALNPRHIRNHQLWDWITILIVINGIISIYGAFIHNGIFHSSSSAYPSNLFHYPIIYYYFYVQLCINSIYFIIISVLIIILQCLGMKRCHKPVRFDSTKLNTSINQAFIVNVIGSRSNTNYKDERCYGCCWWCIKSFSVATKICPSINNNNASKEDTPVVAASASAAGTELRAKRNDQGNVNNNNGSNGINNGINENNKNRVSSKYEEDEISAILDKGNVIGMCILPGRQKGVFFRDLKRDLLAINNQFGGDDNSTNIILVTLCEQDELNLCNCGNITPMIEAMKSKNEKEIEILDNIRLDSDIVFKSDQAIDFTKSKTGTIHQIYENITMGDKFDVKSMEFVMAHSHYPFFDDVDEFVNNKNHSVGVKSNFDNNGGWRDKFIPKSLNEFDLFVSRLASMLKNDSKCKIIVHCNGGVGRTGTLVASMLLKYNDLKQENNNNSRTSHFSNWYDFLEPFRECYHVSKLMRRARKNQMLRNPLQNMFVLTYYNYCCNLKVSDSTEN